MSRNEYQKNYYRRHGRFPDVVEYKVSELELIKKRTLENMIIFNSTELIRCRDTKTRPEVPHRVYRQLIKMGVLRVERSRRVVSYVLSDYALRVIADLELSKMTAKNAQVGLSEHRNVPHGGSRAISTVEVKTVE